MRDFTAGQNDSYSPSQGRGRAREEGGVQVHRREDPHQVAHHRAEGADTPAGTLRQVILILFLIMILIFFLILILMMFFILIVFQDHVSNDDLLHDKDQDTVEIAYKVALCPRVNLLYMQIYLITDLKFLWRVVLGL